MLGKVIAASSIIALMAAILILQTTTPSTIGPFGIFVLFVLVYVSVVGLLTFLLFICSRILAKIVMVMNIRKTPPTTLSLTRSYYFASVLALVPIMVMGMQSIGQVGVYELILLGLFTLVACIYIAKRTK